jgi:hypothetical protein
MGYGTYSVFVAALGTAVVFSAGVASGYTGLGVYNPLGTGTQQAVKIIPIEVTICPTAMNTAANYFALGKFNCSQGTCTGFTAGTFSGTLWQQNVVSGTMAAGFYGNSNARGQPFGTGSMMSAPGWIKMLQSAGTGEGGISSCVYPLSGDITVMPGEGICFLQGIAGTALCSIAWVEVPV